MGNVRNGILLLAILNLLFGAAFMSYFITQPWSLFIYQSIGVTGLYVQLSAGSSIIIGAFHFILAFGLVNLDKWAWWIQCVLGILNIFTAWIYMDSTLFLILLFKCWIVFYLVKPDIMIQYKIEHRPITKNTSTSEF